MTGSFEKSGETLAVRSRGIHAQPSGGSAAESFAAKETEE
jgi:hypothetical protein